MPRFIENTLLQAVFSFQQQTFSYSYRLLKLYLLYHLLYQLLYQLIPHLQYQLAEFLYILFSFTSFRSFPQRSSLNQDSESFLTTIIKSLFSSNLPNPQTAENLKERLRKGKLFPTTLHLIFSSIFILSEASRKEVLLTKIRKIFSQPSSNHFSLLTFRILKRQKT